jgi:hypothetical protein
MYDPRTPSKPLPPSPAGARQVIGTIILILAGFYYILEVFLLGFFTFGTGYYGNSSSAVYLADIHIVIVITFCFELAIAVAGLVLWIVRGIQRKPIFALSLIILGAQILTDIAFWVAVHALDAIYGITAFKL